MHFALLSETTLAPETVWCDKIVPCGLFPGLCRRPDGSLFLMLVCGTAFESADQRMLCFIGSADGTRWQEAGNLGKIVAPSGIPISLSVKPSLLPDGRILALGYGFEREDPDETISGYAEKHGAFPKVWNGVLVSGHAGGAFSPIDFFPQSQRGGVEFSGPAITLRNGKSLAFGPPFNLDQNHQLGLCYESDDGGANWHEKSIYHDSPSITAWESRGMALADNRIAVTYWAHDLRTGRHLTNRIALSQDDGATWRDYDTKLPGQASNLVDLGGGQLGLLQARREGDAPGIYLTPIEITGDGVKAKESAMLYDVTGGRNTEGAMTTQFCNLKFGQPSMEPLQDGTHLLLFWRWNFSSARYEAVLAKYHITP